MTFYSSHSNVEPIVSKLETSMVSHALAYARSGLPVFPCNQVDKSPLTKNGFKDATCDEHQIKEWWIKWPKAMIGVPTGPASGIDVIDLDVKPEEHIDGRKFLRNWKELSTTVVRTPSGGGHIWFRSEGLVRNTTDRIAPGIDTRGNGGYIIVPPSHNSGGGEYKFLRGGLDTIKSLPEFPPEHLAKIGPRQNGRPGTEPEAEATRIAAAMEVIPNADLGWDDWNKFGMAIHRATSGKDEGFQIFDKFSRKSKKYNEDTTREKWDAIARSPPTRIGAGTIFFEADQADPTWRKSLEGLVLEPRAPLESAREFAERLFQRDGQFCLSYYRRAFYEWTGTHWEQCDEDHLRSQLYEFLAQATTTAGHRFNPNAQKVNQIFDALKAGVEVNAKRNAPFFKDGSQSDVESLVACRNGLLNLCTRRLMPHTPDFFNVNCLPFDYDPGAPTYPNKWMKFLREVFPDDEDGKQARLTLQELFGLMLTPDTRQQKIFLLIGPKRSGKGTIGRVLTGLLGKDSVASPTMSGLASHFGLASLIDKRCAIISDARLGPQTNAHTVAERLLSISGEDALTIDRKYKEPWTGRLHVRFLILTNELPGIADSSGALASRFVVLTMQNSFYGKEDLSLEDELKTELPGILNWALAGLARLLKRGHFEMPQSSLEFIRQLEDLASPVRAFVRDWCEIGAGKRIPVLELYDAYAKRCEEEGHKAKSNAWFGRDLRAVVPRIKSRGHTERFYEGIALNEHGRERYELLRRSIK
jgi:putative DNA primase/helicase